MEYQKILNNFSSDHFIDGSRVLARREMKLNMPAGGGTIFHHQKSIFLFSSNFSRASARREMKLNESAGGTERSAI